MLTRPGKKMRRQYFHFMGVGVLAVQLLCPHARAAAQDQTATPSQTLTTEMAYGIFQKNCMSCHGTGNSAQRAPQVSTIRQMSAEAIYAALTTGPMAVQGAKLSDEEKRRVAEALSGQTLGLGDEGDAKSMPNRCASNPPLTDPAAGPAWNGWGVDEFNTRFQGADGARITAEEIPRLKLKWAFGFPKGVSAWGQPTIASGRVFIVSDIGYLYSLDAATGCVYWSFHAKAPMRNAVSVGPVSGQGTAKYAVYFGDQKSNVYAVNAATGEQLWTAAAETNYTARITGAPKLYDGRLYVPVSSWEEMSARSAGYPCCTFRGSVVAFDANTGRKIWKTYTIAKEPKPTKKNSQGTQLWAPAGGAVWNTPVVDAKQHAIYFGTGDSYTDPAGKTTDALMALQMDTGKLLWYFQDTRKDAWLAGCEQDPTENCPMDLGPDWDFANSAILRTLPDGKRILIAAAKSGNVFGLDPDRKGALIWKTGLATKRPGIDGLLRWGGAADSENVYLAVQSGAMVALQLETGKRRWTAPLISPAIADFPGVNAAVSAIPGVAFVGGWDGVLHALSTVDGHQLWEYDTAKKFTTVNEVAANGGSFGAPGPTIAGGMVFTTSGYAFFDGVKTGNVLLAFSPE
jgi:polyvinyl alcohol dehydrogenase (cytochrome)